MQRILNSNQPVAWAFVPLTGLVLFLASVGLGRTDVQSWPGFLGMCVAARLLHLLHVESGMRTRPGSLPSWVWMLVAVPFIGGPSDWAWWASCGLIQGLRLAMGVRDSDGNPGTFLFIGMWWGLAVLAEATIWPLLPAFAITLMLVKRPGADETVSGFIGLLTPLLIATAGVWLMELRLTPCWGWRPERIGMEPYRMVWLAIPTGLGWMLRQQSIVRATAQQRFARQLTQWSGASGVLVVLLMTGFSWTTQGQWPSASSAFPCALAFLASWSWPWLMPPGFKLTKAMPYVFVAMSLALLFLKF
jgi:hypothetical protein